MSADMIAALAQVGTLVVIFGSVVAALVQLRHIRAGNQLQALLSLERDFRRPDLQAALAYIQERLGQRLEERQYRSELERIGFVDPQVHPEMVACNWFNAIGTLLKRGLVAEDTFMDLFGRLIVHCWKLVSPAVAIMRRTRGPAQYHDFEFLAMRAALWLERNPEGFAHRAFNRAPLEDRWRAEDAIS